MPQASIRPNPRRWRASSRSTAGASSCIPVRTTAFPKSSSVSARSHPLAVLTNKPAEPTRRLLEAFDLARHFRWVIGGDSEWPRKPDPGGLRALMQECGAQPDSTWLVGDSMIDVETARRAGTRMCVVLYGFGHLRGELVLDGSESVARTPGDIVGAISKDSTMKK